MHKRYVKRGEKLYGPYFYESFRDEEGKVKNNYLGATPKKERPHRKTALAIATILLGLFFFFNVIEITGLTTTQSGTTNLTILDDTEKANIYYASNRSSSPSIVPFTANYTYTTDGSSITGNCTIAFNTTGTFTSPFQMDYNRTGFLGSYMYNYSFDRKGTFQFNVSCNATGYATLSILDYFTITNSNPSIPSYFPLPGYLPAQTCAEDTACTYNFSLNVTDYDTNDFPLSNFSVLNPFSCISMNSTSGIVTVNCTQDSQTGTFSDGTISSYIVYDSSSGSTTATQAWTVTPVNDPPQFNATNWTATAYEDTFFSYDIDAWDEENGSYPNLHYSINATGSSWFGWLNHSSIDPLTGNISFLAGNSEIGIHNVNVTVNDSTGLSASHNLTINILNSPDAPNLTFACSPNLTINTTEDQLFECYINATDPDPGATITFTANYTFLHLNGTAVPTESGQSGVLLNLTPTDAEVGTWWVNITATDNAGLTDTERIQFIVTNVEEFPYFTNLNNISAYANVRFYYDANATDNDTNKPQNPDSIKFTDNTTLFEININTGVIDFTPGNISAGTHWINITVNDTTDRSTSRVINFTIYGNTAPTYTADGNFSVTEGVKFFHNFTQNFTDAEGDNFTFIDNTTLFDITTYGNVTLNATELDVGTHWVTINATDYRGATSSYVMNFTVYNVNEAPTLFAITGVNTTEGASISFDVPANDSDLLNSRNNENLTFRFNYTWIQFTKVNSTTARVAFTISAEQNGTWWVNCTVNDTAGNEASQVFYMNITESIGYPKFTYVCDDNKTAIEDQRFTCYINASDTDAGAQLTFTANYTWFLLNGSGITIDGSNIASSLVNFTPAYTAVGNWSINISVSDGVYINTTLFYFNVTSVNDRPNITTRDVITGYTLHAVRYDVNATDEEDGNDALTGNLTFVTNNSNFTIDKAGTFAYTPAAGQNGTHWVNVTVNDTQGYGFSYVYNVTIRNNNAPVCHVFLRGSTPTTPPDSFTMNENQSTGQFASTCNDTEGDTITYNWFWRGTLNKSTTSTGWNYTTTFADGGERNITLIVTDGTDNNTYYWNVTVNNTNVAPTLIQNIPNITSGWFQSSDRSMLLTDYFTDQDNDTITYDWYYFGINESFDSISGWSTIQGTWNVTNNGTNSFYNQSATSGNALAAFNDQFDNITSLELKIRAYGNKQAGVCFRAQGQNCSNAYMAYIDGTASKLIWEVREGETATGTATSTNNSLSLTISNDFWYWLKIIAKANNTLVYYSNNSLNYTLAYNITNNTYTSGNIVLFTNNTRADFDDIVLKSQTIKNFTLALNTSASNLTFTPTTSWYGAQPIRITASDGNETTESNVFHLTIYHATPPVETVIATQQLAGGTSLQTRSASLDIIVPAMVTLNALTTTLIPVLLNNSGQVALNTLRLTASTNVTDLKLTLLKSNWGTLGVGEQVATTLEVEAGLLSPQQYVIELVGTSADPKLRQTAKISVDVREREAALKTQLKENIAFTRDLFLQNPECLELTELLDEAQKLYDQKKYTEGLELVKQANEGCKNFLAQKRKVTVLAAKNFIKENWKMLTAEAAGLILLIMLTIYYFRLRKFRGQA